MPQRSPTLDTIEKAIAALVPHAASNYMLPFETPLRWHESRMERAPQPFCFSLWVNLDPAKTRRFEINRQLLPDEYRPKRLWGFSITEPTLPADREADEIVTHAMVDKTGAVELGTARYKISDGGHRTCVGVETDYGLSDVRRAEVVAHMSSVVTGAIATVPAAQEEFCNRLGIDRESRAFEVLGSSASRLALAPLLAVSVQNHA